MANESPKQTAWSKRVDYPLPGGKPLAALPTNFESKKHKPMGRTAFATEKLFCDWWAQVSELKAAYWRKRAKDAGEFGPKKAEVKKAQLVAAATKVKRLQEELAAHGVKL